MDEDYGWVFVFVAAFVVIVALVVYAGGWLLDGSCKQWAADAGYGNLDTRMAETGECLVDAGTIGDGQHVWVKLEEMP